MTLATPALRALAKLLIAEEREEDAILASFQACDRLGRTLTKVVGPAGFRSLLSRAVVLAKTEVPALISVSVLPNGTLGGHMVGNDRSEKEQLTSGASILLAQLLGLLNAFIGESLTMQLVKEAWPQVLAPAFTTTKGHTL
jgi:hypothetical protein